MSYFLLLHRPTGKAAYLDALKPLETHKYDGRTKRFAV
jgi:hypothetical protein